MTHSRLGNKVSNVLLRNKRPNASPLSIGQMKNKRSAKSNRMAAATKLPKLKSNYSIESDTLSGQLAMKNKNKQVGKGKEATIKTSIPKRFTRSSIGNAEINTLDGCIDNKQMRKTTLLHQKNATKPRLTVKGKESSVETKYLKRATCSSLENVEIDTLFDKRPTVQLIRLNLKQLPQKQTKYGQSVKEKKASVETKFPKRSTSSSLENVEVDTLSQVRKLKDKLITLHESVANHMKKNKVKQKKMSVEQDIPKKVTRSSFGNKTFTLVSSPPHQSARKKAKLSVESSNMHKDSKLSSSSAGCVTSFIEMSSQPKTSDSSLKKTTALKSANEETCTEQNKRRTRQSVCNTEPPLVEATGKQKREGQKIRVIKTADVESTNIADSSKRKSRSSSNIGPNADSTMETTEEGRNKTRRKSGISAKVSQMISADSSFTISSYQRNSKEGSSPDKEIPKRNSKVIKGKKRKSHESPLPKNKKVPTAQITPNNYEKDVPVDCLSSNLPSKRPRRHTVDAAISQGKNLSIIQQKTKKAATTKKTSILQKKKKDDGSLLVPSAAPDISIDYLSTVKSSSKPNKGRPKSAPAVGKRAPKSLGVRTPIPKKGTLKRQRWMFNALKEKNEGYEDDIYENQKFNTPVFQMPNEMDDESDTSIATPKFGVFMTPALPKKTPKLKDPISASDLLLARRRAEEYHYRRNKKRTSGNSILESSQASSHVNASVLGIPEKKKLEFAEAMKKVNAIQNKIEKREEEESEEEDAYFSDAS